jgi:hypothetical protein
MSRPAGARDALLAGAVVTLVSSAVAGTLSARVVDLPIASWR